ncbi:hypothetical protein ACWC2H_44340 [Streptomyces sp. 900105755]
MDDQPAHVLDDLYQEGRAHDGPPADRLLRLRNMTPDAARLISTLIRPGAPRPSWRSAPPTATRRSGSPTPSASPAAA